MQEFLIRFDSADDTSLTWLVDAVCVEQAAIIAWSLDVGVFGGPATMPEGTTVVSLPLEINDNVVHVCGAVLEDHGITVAREQIISMINGNEDLRRALFSYYADSKCDGMDTADRDHLTDAFAAQIIGATRWPFFMDHDSEIEREFATKMLAKHENKTIVLSDDLIEAMKARAG